MKPLAKSFARCVDNTDYKASLIPGKVYRIIPDPQAAKDDLVRIVDESGEDYLYHKDHFAFVDLPRAIAKKFDPSRLLLPNQQVAGKQTSPSTLISVCLG